MRQSEREGDADLPAARGTPGYESHPGLRSRAVRILNVPPLTCGSPFPSGPEFLRSRREDGRVSLTLQPSLFYGYGIRIHSEAACP
jgi:hypothetical protein